MADTKLSILPFPTFTKMVLGLIDASTYDEVMAEQAIDITPPGFDMITLPFFPSEVNLFESDDLGITDVGVETCPLPDGIYTFFYSIDPALAPAITGSFMRVEQIQERFDQAFMKLDMMVCDQPIKTQAKVELNTINFFIQGSIAAANNCALVKAVDLYKEADRMLDHFLNNNCGCTGINYVVNYP